MTLKPAYAVAGAIVLVIAVWFAINSRDDGPDLYADVEQKQDTASAAPTVVTRTIAAETRPVRLSLFGRTEPNRRVEVKAKTAASLTATPVAEGTFVRQGQVICRQDVDARQANVDQARAQLDRAESDLAATQVLVDKGYRSATSLPRDRAAVDAARAQVKSAEIELSNVVLRAPFDGVYEQRLAEVGDYLAPGQACALIVELDPLKVEIELTETQVGSVEVGQTVDVALATGERVEGTVQYIETIANPATRTFQMETRLPNPGRALRAGVSATVGVATREVMASLVPASVLTLDDQGETGVRYVDRDGRVRFARTTQVDEDADGLWLTGLPEVARVIVEGQDYVSVGSEVETRQESARPTQSGALAASDYE